MLQLHVIKLDLSGVSQLLIYGCNGSLLGLARSELVLEDFKLLEEIILKLQRALGVFSIQLLLILQGILSLRCLLTHQIFVLLIEFARLLLHL